MEFGIPNRKNKKEEKYNVPVLTFLPTGPGLGRKMELNQAAMEALNISEGNNQVSFSFSGADIYIVNTSGVENVSGLKVGKTSNGFADKKHYEFIKTKTYNLKEEDTLELFLIETENSFNNNTVYKLGTIDTAKFMKGALVEEPEMAQVPGPCSNHEVESQQGILEEETTDYAVTSPEDLYNDNTLSN